MTAPRQVLAGTTYLVTRRCTQRQFLLRPGAATSGVFLYVLAVAALRFGIQLHTFCVLSNHLHLLLTDPEARLPAFAQYFHSLLARALNTSHGRRESFWAPSSYSAVALATPADVLDKAVYVLANPSAAGLVRRGREWPGPWSAPELIGGEALEVPRPELFFRRTGNMPETVKLALVAPPGFESPEAFRELLSEALAEREQQADVERAAAGRTVLGAARAMAQKADARPTASERRHDINPRLAARDKWKRIEAIGRLREFVAAYREAWKQLRAGARDVLFPSGTYWLRVAHGVRCAPQ